MSTEQSVDPLVIEQTKQQIRELVREIAQLSKSDIAPLQFYEAILNRVVAALAAVGGAIWMLNESGQLDLEYQINIRETRLGESQENQVRHGQLLRKVLTSGEGLLAAPHSGAADEKEGANPTDFLLVLGPLTTSSQDTQGLIEVFQRPDSSPTVQRGYLRFLLQMCELASDYLKSRKLRHFTDRQTMWGQLEQFTRVIHRGLDTKLTAYTIANEGRRLIECDRVSVAIRKGRKYVVEAVSGQDTFDKRSNIIYLLGKLATAVAATGETVWYTGDTSDFAPQVEEAVQEYVDEAHSKTVAIVPLKRPRDETEEMLERTHEPQEVLAALIIEQIEDSQPREGLPQRVEIVSEHSATALTNSLDYNSLFLMPVWRTLGKATWVLKARTLPKTLAIAAAVVALITALFVWPSDYELQSKGELVPAVRQDIFADESGQINQLLVDHGSLVKKGDHLAQLHNLELERQIYQTQGDLATTESEIKTIDLQLKEASSRVEKQRLQGEKAGYEKKREYLEEQARVLDERKKHLKVKSPIDGQVTDWMLKELLLGRTVNQGEKLMTVADPSGDMELDLFVPENRMGEIAEARKANPDLKVTYILATKPGQRLTGHIKEVHSLAEVHGDDGNTVKVRVAIDKKDVAGIKPGTGVTAKIYCGRAPIGYTWFHDVFAWAHRVWFRIF
jgi:multidrug efflux pump subunit AcrA (membrane-fusion protein)